MFLFIQKRCLIFNIIFYLNTSHVLIYRSSEPLFMLFVPNLNTSHVLIYPTFLRTSCFL